jgi:glycosyltransferase involved in cell wall biosynthesis
MLAHFPYQEDDLYRGGVMQANYRLINALGKLEGLELYVLMPNLKAKTVETRQHGKVTVIFFPLKNRGYGALLRYRGIRHSFNQLFQKIQPDLLHAQAEPAYILSAIQSQLSSVVTIHGVFRNELPVVKSRKSLRERLVDWKVTRLQDECFKKIRNLIAITTEIENIVKACSPQVRVFRINNAIDDQFFHLTDRNSSPRILFVGWISYRKGIHVLLEAFARLSASLPEAELRLAGLEDLDNEYSLSLRAKYKDLIQGGRIHFLGAISQERLYDEICRCSSLCLPSLAESAPMVIAQAMAAGKPVVATRVGGVPDMVVDGVTGFLCDPGNSEQLAERLITLLKNRSMCFEMGEQAKQLAIKRYQADSVARSTMEAYLQILNRR